MARGREATVEADADADTGGGADEERPGAEARVAASAGPAPSAMMDLEFVKGLIQAVDGSGIDSLEITRAGTRVKISKTPPSAGPAPTYFAAPAQAAPPQTPAPQAAAAAPQPPAGGGGGGGGGAAADEASAEAPQTDSNLVEIKSPMVGTFYRAPAPDAPPYVEVGTRVSKGQTLCILEAMKLMNELESEAEGVVREILIDNAEPVEYGQVIFRIEPNG